MVTCPVTYKEVMEMREGYITEHIPKMIRLTKENKTIEKEEKEFIIKHMAKVKDLSNGEFLNHIRLVQYSNAVRKYGIDNVEPFSWVKINGETGTLEKCKDEPEGYSDEIMFMFGLIEKAAQFEKSELRVSKDSIN